jgi:O-antigen ligase
VLAVTAGRTDFSTALTWARPFFPLAFFFVVVRLFPGGRARQLLTVGAAIGALTGVVALVASLNPAVGDLLQDPSQQFVREREGIGMLERVRLPGVALAYVLVWLPVVRIVESRGLVRLGWLAVLAGMALNIGVSLNRNMWVGLAGGVLLLIVLARGSVRYRLLLALAVGALGTAAMLSLSGDVGPRSSIEPLVERGRTVLDPATVARERSLSSRVSETERAWKVILDSPLTGVGPGAEFGVLFEENRAAVDKGALVPQLFLHNQYLYLLLVGGVPALLAFGAFLVGILTDAWRPRRDSAQTALGVGVAMVMVSALVMITFGNDGFALALGLVGGTVVTIRHGGRPDVGPVA